MSEKTFWDNMNYHDFNRETLEFILGHETNPDILKAMLQQEHYEQEQLKERGCQPHYLCAKIIAGRNFSPAIYHAVNFSEAQKTYFEIYKMVAECSDERVREILASNSNFALTDKNGEILDILCKDEDACVIEKVASHPQVYYDNHKKAYDILNRLPFSEKNENILCALYKENCIASRSTQESFAFNKALCEKAMECGRYDLAGEFINVIIKATYIFNYNMTEEFVEKIDELYSKGEINDIMANDAIVAIQDTIDYFLDKIENAETCNIIKDKEYVMYESKEEEQEIKKQILNDLYDKVEKIQGKINSRDENDSKDNNDEHDK